MTADKGKRKVFMMLVGLILGSAAFYVVAIMKVPDSTFALYLEFVKWALGIAVAGNALERFAVALDKKTQ